MCWLLRSGLPAATRSARCSAASRTSLAARTASFAALGASSASVVAAPAGPARIPARWTLALAAGPAAALQPTEPFPARNSATATYRTRPKRPARGAAANGASRGGAAHHGVLREWHRVRRGVRAG